jgi:hypothetical protein
MERRNYSDKGKGQAISRQKAPDVVRRVAKNTEQQRLQNKPEVSQRRTSSQGSTSGLKKIESKLEKLHVSKPRERNLEGQQRRQGDRHTSNSHQAQRYDALQYRQLMSRSSRASNLGDVGRIRRTLRGGGDPEDSSKHQGETSKEKERATSTAKQTEESNEQPLVFKVAQNANGELEFQINDTGWYRLL